MDAYKLLTLTKADRDKAIKVARAMMRIGIGADTALEMTTNSVAHMAFNRRNYYAEVAHIKAANAR